MSMEQLNEGKRWMLVGVGVAAPLNFFVRLFVGGKGVLQPATVRFFFVFLTHMDLLAEFTLFVGAFHQ